MPRVALSQTPMIVNSLTLVVTILASSAMLKEKVMGVQSLGGTVLILAGIYLQFA